MRKQISRCVSAYDKQTGGLKAEIPLGSLPLAELQRIFQVPPHDEMLEVFDIGPNEAAQLQTYLPNKLDLEMYDYQLDCYASPIADPNGSAKHTKKITFHPFIRFFEKKQDGRLVKNADLDGISVEVLREIFGLTHDEPLEEELSITARHAVALQPFVSEKIDLSQYNCVLVSNLDYIWVPLCESSDGPA